jgi:hypothetical protein
MLRGGTTEEWHAWASKIVKNMKDSNCFALDLNDSRYNSFMDHDIKGFAIRRRLFNTKTLPRNFWQAMRSVFLLVQDLRLPTNKTLGLADVEALCKGASTGPLWGLNLGECRMESGEVADHLANMLPITKIGWLYLDDVDRLLIKDTDTRFNIAAALKGNRQKTPEPMVRNPTTLSALADKHGQWTATAGGIPMKPNPVTESKKRDQHAPHDGAGQNPLPKRPKTELPHEYDICSTAAATSATAPRNAVHETIARKRVHGSHQFKK